MTSISEPYLHLETPVGFNLRQTMHGHANPINSIAWSPNGDTLASSSGDGTVRIWDTITGNVVAKFRNDKYEIYCATWSKNGKMIALASSNGRIDIIDTRTWKNITEIFVRAKSLITLSWSVDGKLAVVVEHDAINIWDTNKWVSIHNLHLDCSALAWSPKGGQMAIGQENGSIWLWNVFTESRSRIFTFGTSPVRSIVWLSDECSLISTSEESIIRVWDTITGSLINSFEGHTGAVDCITMSGNERLLASKSQDGTVRVWRVADWSQISEIQEPSAHNWSSGLAFHPTRPVLATLGKGKNGPDTTIRVWDIDYDVLFAAAPISTIKYTSAKIVLVGESNVGKSCLAMRLAENRYPKENEQGTTHGMRFWFMQPEKLDSSIVTPKGVRRDMVLWDMGGQDEYRLVHQLFLHDSALALVLFDPTRGRTAFDDVEAWNKRLEKQLRGRKATKLLVGTKVDDSSSSVINRKRIDFLVKSCGFARYYETSALNGNGIRELQKGMARALDWTVLAKTSRPELFQRIRDEIETRRKNGDVILSIQELQGVLFERRQSDPEQSAVRVVAEQLATQGVIAVTRLASGEDVLVLQIGEIERYAGSLIVAARDNPRGVPALDKRNLASSDLIMAGIPENKRLPRPQEKVVLECTVQLLIEHGVCFEHEGLLIFPTLYHPTESDESSIPHSISLYYDFSGAIDNIYASLVAWLVISKEFGRVRLWQNRAEFEISGSGTCGIRKVDRGGGFAHVDVYFHEDMSQTVRERFISIVEEHLRQYDVDIVEHIEITCVCGYDFSEETIRKRISEGHLDIGCPDCDHRTKITEGAIKARSRDPELVHRSWALRTEVEKQRKQIVNDVKKAFAESESKSKSNEPIRILHLSDLHFDSKTDPIAKLQPLFADLHDKDGGLGFERLDYLVVSGDFTMRANPNEFELARQFVSGLIEEFELTAERCIIVPGNHDLSWDEDVYNWKPGRKVKIEELSADQYLEQGDGYLILDEKRYPNRLINFSHDFYHPLLQKEYPLAFKEQCIPILFEQTGIQFITLNSSWKVDEWFQRRSNIHPDALAYGLSLANMEIKKARLDHRLDKDANILRIGVWHHPVSGNGKIEDEAFLRQLQQANVRVCLHGHVHESRADLAGYLYPNKIYIVGAGTFGGMAEQRPESTPRLYNLLEVSRDHLSIKVHTRCMQKDGGAWEGWAVWPGSNPTEKRSYYKIE
jgi:small GTP-binding protein